MYWQKKKSWFEQERAKLKRRTRVSTDPISRVDRGHHENTDLDEGAFSKTFLMTLLTARIYGLYNLFEGVGVEAV